jgi:hypothetical protein
VDGHVGYVYYFIHGAHSILTPSQVRVLCRLELGLHFPKWVKNGGPVI